jgi:type II secretory pathway pseudopilin PulG
MLKKEKNKSRQIKKGKWGRGFTLVETLLYVSIVSVVLLLLSAFIFMLLQSRTKYQTISEVDQEGIQVAQIMAQTIRNAKKINLPAQGALGATLSLDMTDAGKSPTIFNSSGTNVQMKEGTGALVPLTASKVVVSGLTFANVSATNTPGIVKFQFTLTYSKSSDRNEYDYSRTFYGSAALRFN